MYVNQLPFVVTYGRGVGFTTVQWIPNRTVKQLAININEVIQLYSRAGFTVQTHLVDMEFEKLQLLLPMANINLSAPNEHVAKIEQCIQIVKEWCQGVMATLPVYIFPKPDDHQSHSICNLVVKYHPKPIQSITTLNSKGTHMLTQIRCHQTVSSAI